MGWLLLFGAPTLKAQIDGVWYFMHNSSKVEIYQKSNLFFSKIVGLKESKDKKSGNPLTDTENHDPLKRSQLVIGLEIISDLQFIENNNWDNGL